MGLFICAFKEGGYEVTARLGFVTWGFPRTSEGLCVAAFKCLAFFILLSAPGAPLCLCRVSRCAGVPSICRLAQSMHFRLFLLNLPVRGVFLPRFYISFLLERESALLVTIRLLCHTVHSPARSRFFVCWLKVMKFKRFPESPCAHWSFKWRRAR